MKHFIIYDEQKNIKRTGSCSKDLFHKQTRDGEFTLEGEADDATQEIEFDGLDENGQPINPRIVDKPSADIPVSNLTKDPILRQITGDESPQIQDILKRVDALEIALRRE